MNVIVDLIHVITIPTVSIIQVNGDVNVKLVSVVTTVMISMNVVKILIDVTIMRNVPIL